MKRTDFNLNKFKCIYDFKWICEFNELECKYTSVAKFTWTDMSSNEFREFQRAPTNTNEHQRAPSDTHEHPQTPTNANARIANQSNENEFQLTSANSNQP